MAEKDYLIPEVIAEYLGGVAAPELPLLRELREETASQPMAIMQIPAGQGQLLSMLVRLLGVRRALEVGVFTGYSSLCVALGLPEDGQLVACDVSEEYTAVARRYWERAGVAHKVDLRIGPAAETLDGLLASGAAGSFDLAFIDADKPSYDRYYEQALRLVRANGLIVVDNALQRGRVADAAATDEGAVALRALNAKMARDERVQGLLLPYADGVWLARVV